MRLWKVVTLALLIVALTVPSAYACKPNGSWCGKKHSASYNKDAIRYEAKRAGYGAAGTNALLWIANHESTYRNWVSNGSCKGLFQIKTSLSKSSWANPYYNTRRAIAYIKHRYGSPNKAVAYWKANGHY